MWSDNEATIDLLGYRHLVGAVLSIVRDDRLLPATIGVFGDWGSGKSSLIRMACEAIKDEKTLVITFNGWLFEGYEDAKTAIMGTIIDELADKKNLTVRGKELVLRLVRRINLFRFAGAAGRVALGYAIGGIAGAAMGAAPDLAMMGAALTEKAKDIKPEDMGEFLRNEDPGQQLRRGVREFREDFAELLGETKIEKLVVVVDDLDRCNPDTIIETLEAIKLFLFVPKTAFVIGADERLIRYAVRRRFPELPGERAEVGRDYLEKLVQFPIRVPSMGRTETDTYIKLLLADRCAIGPDIYERIRSACVVTDSRLEFMLDHAALTKALGAKPMPELDEALALAERISPVLAAGLLGNPRQCKRFLNTLIMRHAMAKSRGIELKRRVLAKLMLLEYLHPESFKELARLQAEQVGKPAELGAAETPQVASDDDDGATPGKPKNQLALAKPPVNALLAWHSDLRLSEWLTSEPKLAAEDLRPYFYFSRDKLEPVGVTLRMSPDAQEALSRILGASEADRTAALGRTAQMSPADAAAIFEALATRARESETVSAVDSPIVRMCEVVERRAELFSELITFFKSLPVAAIPFAIVPRFVGLASTPDSKAQVSSVLETWKATGTTPLRKAATNHLEKLAK